MFSRGGGDRDTNSGAGVKRKFCFTPRPSDDDVKRVENLAGLTIASTPDAYDTVDDVFAQVFAKVESSFFCDCVAV